MVSRDEARQVFGRAFSRPPRLLFTNPVCLIFSLYYAYIYGASPRAEHHGPTPGVVDCADLFQASSTSSSFPWYCYLAHRRSIVPDYFHTCGLKAQSHSRTSVLVRPAPSPCCLKSSPNLTRSFRLSLRRSGSREYARPDLQIYDQTRRRNQGSARIPSTIFFSDCK